MAKFMNAELIAIRDALQCAHCRAIFKGSDSQAWKVRYEKQAVYCSLTCRKAGVKNKVSKPVPECGPCPTCKQKFYSRNKEKIFCSLKCYIDSDQMKTMMAENRQKTIDNLRAERDSSEGAYLGQKTKNRLAEIRRKAGLSAGQDVACLECSTVFWQKPETKDRAAQKFCDKSCYRAYKAKRFDRWIANPQQLQLPQNYDEFLSQQELPCLIEGCEWKGFFLSLHVNQAHGITAKEFKRAAGFNLNTGLVSQPLAKLLSEHAVISQRLLDQPPGWLAGQAALQRLREEGLLYRSKEAIENTVKGRILALAAPGPSRICLGCHRPFQQTTALGRKLYCTVECRDAHYAEQKRVKDKKPRERNTDGTFK